jgi:hypothetical protein
LASPALAFFGGLLLLVTLVAAVAGGLAVPGIIVLGASQPSAEIKSFADILCDTAYFNWISSAAMILAGALVLAAASLLVLSRRWAGGVHIVRAVIGCAGLLLSIYAFWATVVPGPYYLAEAVARMKERNVQATVQALARAGDPAGLVIAALLLLGAIVVLAWPPRQRVDVPAAAEGV